MQYALDDDNVKVEILRLANSGHSIRQIEEKLGVSKSSINRFVLKQSYKDWWEKNQKPIAAGTLYDHHTDIKKLGRKRYILTSAQNNTFVHDKFLLSLQTACDYLDAQLIVGTFSYNTHGFQDLEKSEGDWFDPKIEPYILDEPVELFEGLIWCGELNILPTAVNPLSGFHSYTKDWSGIIPHVKMQLESLPRYKTEPERTLFTTGCVTQRNYIQKKAGQKASFHHIFGALLAEVDEEGDWFVRQLVADSETGVFQDLDVLYTPEYPVTNAPVEAINWGDIHVEKQDEEAVKACFYNKDSMLKVLRPTYQFIHDVLDFESRNHHNINDPYHLYKMYIDPTKTQSVKDNCDKVCEFLESIKQERTYTVVVESNHDLALKRWLKESDYKRDPVNAVFYLECQLAMYKSIERGEKGFSILGDYVQSQCGGDIAEFLHTDESYMICGENGIECGSHGDLGPNGSRGSALSLAKLGKRMNIGHSHTAKIYDGIYQAGHLMDIDKVDYARGPTSWSHSNIVTYPNGKRTMVTLKNGKWHA